MNVYSKGAAGEKSRGWRIFWCIGVSLLMLASCKEEKIDFSAQVKPILNKRCISCHGGVKRSADFSVLFRHDALDTVESGKPAIIPFDAKNSEMIRRLTLTNPEERMPLKEEPLSQEEIDILTKWIDQGAEWGDHWAYLPPQAVAVPDASELISSFKNIPQDWPKNEVDHFVLATLKQQEMQPSLEADKATLLRRVYFDITGIPPTPAQAEKFLKDNSPNAYEKTVDELLASPRFGEKWASWWLDLARYSDTKGYERDAARNIWRYRDWVIKAFNKDMPFDQFTTEQLAGDMLLNPTDDQLIATAFHRNTMNNDEGGTQDEEFRVAALLDRVSTTWEVWQSTTMACVQCHTHPYDPFLHEEYYKSLAFFNNTRDEDTNGEHPNMRTYSEEDEKKVQAIRQWVKEKGSDNQSQEVTRFLKTMEPKYHAHVFDAFINTDLIDTKFLGIRGKSSARPQGITLKDKDYIILFYQMWRDNTVLEIRMDKPDGEVIASQKVEKTSGGRKPLRLKLKPTAGGKHDLYLVMRNTAAKPEETLGDIEWVAFMKELPGKDTREFASIDQTFMKLLESPVDDTPVMIENKPEQHRKTHVFERGNWLVNGEEVQPEVPKSLNPFPKDAPANRLGFSEWLMDEKNPLTARTMVNRVWEQIFGYGIVETLEDFGTQGAAPSHPELLDWLAIQYRSQYAWSTKKLIKTIVMSGTYRQDSRVSPELYEADATNRWLARGPRVRLSAEEVRDQVLAVSGLLSTKMYGKSVMPYQPKGIWSTVYNSDKWHQSEGEDQFRRTVYTYSKRTSPFPGMIMFDGASREVCVSRRIRTNTPLQALVTLNDSSYVVAARSFARQIAKQAATPRDQIQKGYHTILLRDMPAKKLDILTTLYNEALKKYTSDKTATKELMADDKSTPQLAALTVVSQALLNLDEVITKE